MGGALIEPSTVKYQRSILALSKYNHTCTHMYTHKHTYTYTCTQHINTHTYAQHNRPHCWTPTMKSSRDWSNSQETKLTNSWLKWSPNWRTSTLNNRKLFEKHTHTKWMCVNNARGTCSQMMLSSPDLAVTILRFSWTTGQVDRSQSA